MTHKKVELEAQSDIVFSVLNFLCVVAFIAISAMALIPLGMACAAASVDGVVGISGGSEGSYFAVYIPIPSGQALSGVEWFNNDGGYSFPAMYIGTGHVDGPGLLQDCELVAEIVSGPSSDWSSFQFEAPIGASLDGLYLVFGVDNQVEYSNPGLGGGPALGYVRNSQDGVGGWISGDGELWFKMHQSCSFAVNPMLVEATEGMLIKSMDNENQNEISFGLSAHPNPANPTMRIDYSLTKPGMVTLEVFDLRGARIRRLVAEVQDPGQHHVDWIGTDSNGRSVASGVYFARLITQEGTLTKRVTFVR